VILFFNLLGVFSGPEVSAPAAETSNMFAEQQSDKTSSKHDIVLFMTVETSRLGNS